MSIRRLGLATNIATSVLLFMEAAHASYGFMSRYNRGNGSLDLSLNGSGDIVQSELNADVVIPIPGRQLWPSIRIPHFRCSLVPSDDDAGILSPSTILVRT
jgi:hypothetical protein